MSYKMYYYFYRNYFPTGKFKIADILRFAAYFLYMIFFIIPVSNDDSVKSSKKEFLL